MVERGQFSEVKCDYYKTVIKFNKTQLGLSSLLPCVYVCERRGVFYILEFTGVKLSIT